MHFEKSVDKAMSLIQGQGKVHHVTTRKYSSLLPLLEQDMEFVLFVNFQINFINIKKKKTILSTTLVYYILKIS